MQKTALITGASRGIGRAAKAIFEEHGYEVIAPTRAEMDLSDPQAVTAYCDGLISKGAHISTIVNNAGINEINEIERQLGYPITMVSNGPAREDIIYRTPLI